MTAMDTTTLAPERLLDRAQLLSAIRAGSPDARSLAGVRPVYVRLKPGRSALLGLRLQWADEPGPRETFASLYVGDGAADAAAKAATLRLVPPSLGPTVVRIDDPAALLLAFPNDRRMRGLSAAADARRLGNRLARTAPSIVGPGWRVRRSKTTVEAVRWKPGRRAVLLASLALRHDASGEDRRQRAWIRVWPIDELCGRLAAWRASARVPEAGAPVVLAVDEERGFAVFEDVVGEPWTGALPALVPALSALYRAPIGLPGHVPGDELSAARRTLAALAALDPSHAARATALSQELDRAFESLAPASATLVHGDLGADQILATPGGVRLLDWDEAKLGDPHADFASLAADLLSRGFSGAEADTGALGAEVLGRRYDAARWRAQLSAAHARRALAPLQRADADWRRAAVVSLEAAERALFRSSSPRATSGPRTFAALLDPAARAALPGVGGRALALAAVWPDGAGVVARLEDPARRGRPLLWLRFEGTRIESHPFPDDPALPALRPLLAGGAFTLAGHRYGRRAALREKSGERFLFLRRASHASALHAAACAAADRLAAAGLPYARPLGEAPESSGWWTEAIRGTVQPARALREEAWEALGDQLARVHAQSLAVAPGGTEPGLDLALAERAARRQVALTLANPDGFGDALAARLEAWSPRTPVSGTRAYIHGDLHPGQLVTGNELVIVDWERARVGVAEEDLGNLAAHLLWELGERAAGAWRTIIRGYESAGRGWIRESWRAHARLALVRVVAVWSWRDGSSERARDLTRWVRAEKEMASW